MVDKLLKTYRYTSDHYQDVAIKMLSKCKVLRPELFSYIFL